MKPRDYGYVIEELREGGEFVGFYILDKHGQIMDKVFCNTKEEGIVLVYESVWKNMIDIPGHRM